METQARVVVIGGGVAGCSVLYHLTKLGWSDVLLVEENELTSGSTWHAAGLCTQFHSSYNLMNLLRYSIELYESLEAETGQAVDYHRCGSVRLAASNDRLDEFRHRKGIADTLGVPCEIISPEATRELFPLANMDGVVAACHLPTDGYIDPTALTHAFVKGATAKGAKIQRQTAVTGIERSGGDWLVKTNKGDIRAEIVVNAAGQWARQVGQMVGANLPIMREFDESIACSRRALRERPNNVRALHRLAIAEAYNGNLEAARAAYAESERILPAPPLEFFTASYPFTHSEDLDFILDGIRKAGWEG